VFQEGISKGKPGRSVGHEIISASLKPATSDRADRIITLCGDRLMAVPLFREGTRERTGGCLVISRKQQSGASSPSQRVSETSPMSDSTGASSQPNPGLTVAGLQQLIRRMYHDKDAARGIEGTFMWFTEEVGELASALRGGTKDEQTLEFADVIAWLVTMANVAEIDLEAALMRKYGGGCPGCGRLDCVCPDAEKP